jgi:hypothetical protein
MEMQHTFYVEKQITATKKSHKIIKPNEMQPEVNYMKVAIVNVSKIW